MCLKGPRQLMTSRVKPECRTQAGTWGVALGGEGLLDDVVDLLPQDAEPVVHLWAVAPDVQRVRGVADRVHQQREGFPARRREHMWTAP